MKGLEWAKNHRLISALQVDLISHWLRSSATLILFLIPGPFVAMIAGATYLRPSHFFKIMIPSQIFWIVACYLLGSELEVYLNLVKDFFIKHGIALTCVLVFIKLLQGGRKKS